MVARWTEETLFTSGDKFFDELVKSIRRARSSIELECYIVVKGVLGDRIIGELIEAARRGVQVRLLIDGWGSPNFMWDYWPQLKAAGIKVRFYRVFPFILRKLPGDPNSFFKRLLLRWRQMNHGNHRKFCLIDNEELYVGSFNISDVHLQELTGEDAWKDIGIRVRGGDLKYARRAFQRAYRGWTAFNLPARSPRLLLLNDSYLHKRSTRNQIIQQLKKAQRRIWLATPYFVPIGTVLRLLVKQAKAGLDVRLIIPQKNDIFFMHWISLPLLKDLANHGAKIFIYQPRFAHQKIFIADDWMCIGSSNLNHRSFLHDLEMDVVITNDETKAQLEATYLEDQKASEPFDRSEWANLPIWQRWVGSFFILLKYWA